MKLPSRAACSSRFSCEEAMPAQWRNGRALRVRQGVDGAGRTVALSSAFKDGENGIPDGQSFSIVQEPQTTVDRRPPASPRFVGARCNVPPLATREGPETWRRSRSSDCPRMAVLWGTTSCNTRQPTPGLTGPSRSSAAAALLPCAPARCPDSRGSRAAVRKPPGRSHAPSAARRPFSDARRRA